MTTSISAGGLVINSTGQVILVKQQGDSWSFPKGHVKTGEDLLVAAKREVMEESGVTDLRVGQYLGTITRPNLCDPGEIKVIHMFLFTSDQVQLIPQDPDNAEARWVDQDEVCTLLSAEQDRNFFQSFQAGEFGSPRDFFITSCYH